MSIKIKVSNLQKKYGNNLVLKDISFEVEQGTIFAILGVNGAGKTTTLECIEGVRKYNNGKITVNGSLGVQLQTSSLPNNIKAIEALKLFSKWTNNSIDMSLVTRLGLSNILKKQYKELSIGQKRRLHLALSLISNPDIIILDEPTAGLDIEGRVALHDEIKALKAQGKTIIMSSHDMAEVETLCDKLAILKDGKIAFTGTPYQLTCEMKNLYHIKLKLSSSLSYKDITSCTYKEKLQEYYIFETNSIHQGLLELLILAKKQNITIYDLKIEHGTLEECFINIARSDY